MKDPARNRTTRRDVLRGAVGMASASALAGTVVPAVHAGEDHTIRLAIVGSGSRGTGALVNALSTTSGPVQLVAMADLFPDRIASSYKTVKDQFGAKVDVPPERQFLGLDAYKQAIDCLRPGDVALLTTHAAFRPLHMAYAVQKGVNVFMEKSFAPDPGGTQQMLETGKAAGAKNLKVAAGLMCRHSVARQAMIRRMRDGLMGEVLLIRAQRLGPTIALPPRKPDDGPELAWQIRRSFAFPWLSSGLFMEMTIHQIDECCWIKDGWPVSAQGLGGRDPLGDDASQNLDSYDIEYTFADGAKAIVQGRYLSGGHNDFATYVHGSKCAGQFSGNIHAATVFTCKGRVFDPKQAEWRPPAEPCDPWQAEWNDLMMSIREDRPHNETERACHANLAAIMGRAAVHGSTIVTWDEVMSSRFRFCPDVAALTMDGPAPVQANAQGRYPVPSPGTWNEI